VTTPDLTTYHVVHRALRQAARSLAETTGTLDPGDRKRAKAIARYWKGYMGEIVAHHKVEDELFFPALVERVPEAARHVTRTDAEHHHLDELLAACTAAIARVAEGGDPAAAATLVAQVADHLDEHLDFEDADVLPLFERHFTAEEYQALDAKAVEHVGIGKQAAFTVPFVVSYTTAAEFERMLTEAPRPMRILWRLTRRGHARLARRALGAAPAPAAALPVG
jgi:hemerythrin-like domain-containing protein